MEPTGLAADSSCTGRGVTGEPATLSGSGSSAGAGSGAGMSLGGGDADRMVAGCSSSSSSEEDSDEEEEDEEEEDVDEELDELLLSESDVLSFSPSESAYREHLEDESLSSSSPGNPEGAIRQGGSSQGYSLTHYYGYVRLCARC